MKAIACISLVLFTAGTAAAQRQTPRSDTGTVSLTLGVPFAAIHVALPGDIVLHAWNEPRAEVRVVDDVSGRVIGYSNETSRRDYSVRITATDAGIVIAPDRRSSLVTIGFSTIREHLRHDVYLPAAARICVDDNKNDLTVHGAFAALDIAGGGARPVKLRGATSSAVPVAECR